MLGKARKLGLPFERKSSRGRPFAACPCAYAALFIIFSLFDLSLRDDEWFSESIVGRHIDHSTFGRSFAKIPPHYLHKLLLMTRNTIRNATDETPVLIADSTGVVLDRIYEHTTVKLQREKRKQHVKLHILAEYYHDTGVIAIAAADALSRSDARAAREMLQRTDVGGRVFYADAGYDAEPLYETCYTRGLQPMIKMRRSTTHPRKYRRRAFATFDRDHYKRYRGVIEGVFGGLETRRLLYSRYKKEEMILNHLIAMAVVQNLHTCMSLLLLILIKSTTSMN